MIGSCLLTKVAANVLQLAEGGDFQHSLSYEALKFLYPQNCPTKNETATFGKVLLPAYPSFSVVLCWCLSAVNFVVMACVSGVLIFFLSVGKNFKILFSVAKKYSLKNFGSWSGLQRFLRVYFYCVGILYFFFNSIFYKVLKVFVNYCFNIRSA